MASLTITVPDELVTEIVQSVEEEFTRSGGETDADLMRRYMKEHLRKCVHRARVRNALAIAEQGVEVPTL